MKPLVLSALVGALVLATPAFAEDAHHPQAAAPAAKVKKPVPNKALAAESMNKMDQQMTTMHEMHEKMMAAQTPEERSALMADHMKAMQGGMSMMQGRMPSDPATRQQMMEKRMDMMESTMQMMMDRLPPAAAK